MEQGENEVSSDDESFIEIQINKQATRLSISSSSSSPSDPNSEMHAIFSSSSSCFSGYTSVMRLVMKLGCMSIVGVIRDKVNVGEKWVLKVIHKRRRNKSSLQYYCEGGLGSNNHIEDTILTDDSLKAAIAYCNASSLSPLQTH